MIAKQKTKATTKTTHPISLSCGLSLHLVMVSSVYLRRQAVAGLSADGPARAEYQTIRSLGFAQQYAVVAWGICALYLQQSSP